MAQIENTAISSGERLMLWLTLDAWSSVIRLSPMIAIRRSTGQ
jgi:hypothetical protein